MYLSNQSLLAIILVGASGWRAGRVMEGGGLGLIVGLVGAFVGDWLLPRLGIHLGSESAMRSGKGTVPL